MILFSVSLPLLLPLVKYQAEAGLQQNADQQDRYYGSAQSDINPLREGGLYPKNSTVRGLVS